MAFKYSTRDHKMQQMLRRQKARLLFMEEGAGEKNEKKTTQGAARQKPFLLSVTLLRALPRVAPVPGGMKALISILLGMPSVMMAPSLWLKQVPTSQVPVWAPDVGELCPQSPPSTVDKISLPRHDLLGEGRWPISPRRRSKSLFLNGLLLGSICIGIQVKLINHRQ